MRFMAHTREQTHTLDLHVDDERRGGFQHGDCHSDPRMVVPLQRDARAEGRFSGNVVTSTGVWREKLERQAWVTVTWRWWEHPASG